MGKKIFYLATDTETLGFDSPCFIDGKLVQGFQYFPLVQVGYRLLDEDLNVLISDEMFIQPTAEEMARAGDGVIAFHVKNGFDKQWEAGERIAIEQCEARVLEKLTEYFTQNHPDYLVKGRIPNYSYDNDFSIIVHGKSVGFDKKFMAHYIPRVAMLLSHQTADTSAVRTMMYASKVLPNRLGNHQCSHFTLDDVDAAINDQKVLLGFMEVLANALPKETKFETLEDMLIYIRANGIAYIAPENIKA